jgi:hypothetical protein
MKKFFSIIALGAMTLSLSSFNSSNQVVVLDDGDPVDCNRQARMATMQYAIFVHGEEASGDSENNDLYVAFHNALYETCLAED